MNLIRIKNLDQIINPLIRYFVAMKANDVSYFDLLTWVEPPPLQAMGRDEAPPYISDFVGLLANVTFPASCLLE